MLFGSNTFTIVTYAISAISFIISKASKSILLNISLSNICNQMDLFAQYLSKRFNKTCSKVLIDHYQGNTSMIATRVVLHSN